MTTYYVYLADTKEVIASLTAPEGLDKDGFIRYATPRIFLRYEIDDGGRYRVDGHSKTYYLWWDEFGVTTSFDGLFLCY